MAQYTTLPPATTKACEECPWLRTAMPGHLGPIDAEGWVDVAHSDEPVACHKTIRDVGEDGFGSWDHPNIRQCAGLAQFRENICKSPRDPQVAVADARDTETVFGWGDEFIAHHTGQPMPATRRGRSSVR